MVEAEFLVQLLVGLIANPSCLDGAAKVRRLVAAGRLASSISPQNDMPSAAPAHVRKAQLTGQSRKGAILHTMPSRTTEDHTMSLAPPSTKFQDFARMVASATDDGLGDLAATRRGLILAPLLAAVPAALLAAPAHAVDPAQTQVILPDQYQWRPALPSAPAQSVETVAVFGATDKPGPYVVLVKWHPGYMSAPHTYVTDRLCFVISGTWWVNSGETFEPEGDCAGARRRLRAARRAHATL